MTDFFQLSSFPGFPTWFIKTLRTSTTHCPWCVDFVDMMGRFLQSCISVVFLVFTVVQLNDEDYYVWVPIYLLPAVLNSIFLFPLRIMTKDMAIRMLKLVMLSHFLVCVVMSLTLVWNKNWARQLSMKETDFELIDPLTDPAFEVERELGGLWICMWWSYQFWPAPTKV